MHDAVLEGDPNSDIDTERKAVLAGFSILTLLSWSPAANTPLTMQERTRKVIRMCLLYHGKHICQAYAMFCVHASGTVLDRQKMSRLLKEMADVHDSIELDVNVAIDWLETVINKCYQHYMFEPKSPFRCNIASLNDWSYLLDDTARIRVTEYVVKSLKCTLISMRTHQGGVRGLNRLLEILAFCFSAFASVKDETSTATIIDFQATIRELLMGLDTTAMFLETVLYMPQEFTLNPAVQYTILATLMDDKGMQIMYLAHHDMLSLCRGLLVDASQASCGSNRQYRPSERSQS